MCTCIIAGRKTSMRGRAMLAANDDWDDIPGVLTHVPRTVHAPGETYTLVGGRKIPQIPETNGYSYTACKYSIGVLDRGWAGGMNDRGVAAAGTGASAFKPVPWEGMDYGLEPDDVVLLILQRASTAREGIRLVGDLINEHGLRPSSLDGCESAATFAVADAREGWFLEVAPGRNWIAVRVPDDEIAVRANAFGTCGADLTDTENVIASPGLAEYARRMGWWDGDIRRFDFAAAYGADVSPNEWGPELDPMNMRRRWRVMDLASGRETDEAQRLYSIKPDRLLTREDLMDMLSDVYQGTKYDLTKVPEAGKWGDPFTDDAPSYALCRRGTVSCIVAEPEEDGPSSVMWTAMTTPRMSFFVPLCADIESLPDYCPEPDPGKESLFWSFKELGLLTQRRYSRHIAVTAAAKERYETESKALLLEEKERIAALPETERRSARTAFTRERLDAAMALCRETKRELLLQY